MALKEGVIMSMKPILEDNTNNNETEYKGQLKAVDCKTLKQKIVDYINMMKEAIRTKFSKQKKNNAQEDVRFVNPEELEQKINCYIKARGITREELEAPILEILNIKDLEKALKFLDNCDLAKYSSLQLFMIARHLDELQVLYAEKCKKKKKIMLPLSVGIILLADLLSSILLVPLCGVSLLDLAHIVGAVDICMTPWIVGMTRVSVDSEYYNTMKKLDDIGEKILLVASAKTPENIIEKEIVEEREISIQERVTKIEKDIAETQREDLQMALINSLVEYNNGINLDKTCADVPVLELCGKPYYEYVLEKNLERIEKELSRVNSLKCVSANLNSVFDDYLMNVENFTDKKEALLELMNIIQNSINVNPNSDLFATCFWHTIKLVEMIDRVAIIQGLSIEVLDRVIIWMINSIASYGESYVQQVQQESQNVSDKRLYLLLLVDKLEKLEAMEIRESKRERARKNTQIVAQTN